MRPMNCGIAALACAFLLALCGCAETGNPAGKDAASTAQSSAATASDRPEDDSSTLLPSYRYELLDIHEVDGRQGVAAENGNVWVSGSAALSRYDGDWNLQASNSEPFATGFEGEVNHIGDIDVYQGEVYAGAELFLDGEASNIQVAVYDGETLELKRTFPFDAESGQDECSGIAVDPDSGCVYMCSWTATGRYLYRYDLESGAYLGRVQLHASPQWIQGVAWHDGSLYLTADDGDADYGEPDHLYRATVSRDATHATAALERTFDDVTRQGEIEGLSFTEDGRLLLLYNRGAHIVLGMPSGFYEGYTSEIHEVFTYQMDRR